MKKPMTKDILKAIGKVLPKQLLRYELRQEPIDLTEPGSAWKKLIAGNRHMEFHFEGWTLILQEHGDPLAKHFAAEEKKRQAARKAMLPFLDD